MYTYTLICICTHTHIYVGRHKEENIILNISHFVLFTMFNEFFIVHLKI